MWLYYHCPPSLRLVGQMLVACGLEVTYETIPRWVVKFGCKRRQAGASAVAYVVWSIWMLGSGHPDAKSS